MIKNLRAAIRHLLLCALVLFAQAAAAQIVVTPGSVAGYTYFPGKTLSSGDSPYLHRNDVGNPALNTMNTPLILGAGAVATAGSACATDGAIARDSSSAILSCQSGQWKKQASGCVLFSGDVNGLQNDGCYNGVALGNAPVADWVFVEVMRHPNMANYNTVQRATAMTGLFAGDVWIRSQQSSSSGAGWGPWRKQRGCVNASASDLNLLTDDGCFNGENFGNAPTNAWLFVEVLRHFNLYSYYTVQRATAMTAGTRGDAGQVWVRSQQSGAAGQGWGPWRKQTGCNEFWADLNTLQEDGCYNGSGLGNAPAPDWMFVEVLRHYDRGSYYTMQRATAMTGGLVGEVWVRSQQGNTWGGGWSAWKKLGATKPPITDMCMVDASNAENQLLDGLCQASCGTSQGGTWRSVGSWDADRGVGVGRRSIRVDEGVNFITSGYMVALCAKVDS